MNEKRIIEMLVNYTAGSEIETDVFGENENRVRELFAEFNRKWQALPAEPEGFTPEQDKVADELLAEYARKINKVIWKFRGHHKVVRYEVRAYCSYAWYYYNPETNEFDHEGCVFETERYSWTSAEQMFRDFFKNFEPLEFKNSLDTEITLCKVTEYWTREDIEDEWDFDSSQTEVLIRFTAIDYLKNNGYVL